RRENGGGCTAVFQPPDRGRARQGSRSSTIEVCNSRCCSSRRSPRRLALESSRCRSSRATPWRVFAIGSSSSTRRSRASCRRWCTRSTRSTCATTSRCNRRKPSRSFRPFQEAKVLIRVTDEELRAAEAVAAVASPEAGAINTFHGVVRNNNLGRGVSYLVYEAYPSMAEKVMREIAEEAREKFGLIDCAVLHR